MLLPLIHNKCQKFNAELVEVHVLTSNAVILIVVSNMKIMYSLRPVLLVVHLVQN